MSMSSPSNVRLPHASAGPFWCPPPIERSHEWHEIETLLALPVHDSRPSQAARRGIHGFVLVATALVLGGGVFAVTSIGSRPDCGAACHVVAATAAPSGAAPRAVDTAAVAPAPDATLKEGRSAAAPVLDMTAPASPTDSATSDPVIPEPIAPPLPHRHHHHHHFAHP